MKRQYVTDPEVIRYLPAAAWYIGWSWPWFGHFWRRLIGRQRGTAHPLHLYLWFPGRMCNHWWFLIGPVELKVPARWLLQDARRMHPSAFEVTRP